MNPEVRTVDDVTILTPHGMLLGGRETDELKQRVAELDEKGNMKLLINLGKTTFTSSVGLTVLFLAHTKYSRRGGTVKLCSVDRRIKQLFVLVKLTLVYGENLHETEEEALAAFRALPALAIS
ncbi:MAG TPA: STAS domain-containing protein [Candidatus Eisenbacteria bacterium]|nr:STAS domain-containing protein [Candidatus Eisenbacteria bacterium]